VYVCGLVHATNAPLSIEHSIVASGSSTVNVKVASGEFDGDDGALVISIIALVVSTVHVNDAGLGSVLPAASVARTSNVCEPSMRPVNDSGLEQA